MRVTLSTLCVAATVLVALSVVVNANNSASTHRYAAELEYGMYNQPHDVGFSHTDFDAAFPAASLLQVESAPKDSISNLADKVAGAASASQDKSEAKNGAKGGDVKETTQHILSHVGANEKFQNPNIHVTKLLPGYGGDAPQPAGLAINAAQNVFNHGLYEESVSGGSKDGSNSDESYIDWGRVTKQCPRTPCGSNSTCPHKNGVCCNNGAHCCPSDATCVNTNPPTCVRFKKDSPRRCAISLCEKSFSCKDSRVNFCCAGGTMCCESGYQCNVNGSTTMCTKIDGHSPVSMGATQSGSNSLFGHEAGPWPTLKIPERLYAQLIPGQTRPKPAPLVVTVPRPKAIDESEYEASLHKRHSNNIAAENKRLKFAAKVLSAVPGINNAVNSVKLSILQENKKSAALIEQQGTVASETGLKWLRRRNRNRLAGQKNCPSCVAKVEKALMKKIRMIHVPKPYGPKRKKLSAAAARNAFRRRLAARHARIRQKRLRRIAKKRRQQRMSRRAQLRAMRKKMNSRTYRGRGKKRRRTRRRTRRRRRVRRRRRTRKRRRGKRW
jgi:hypothetical protein